MAVTVVYRSHHDNPGCRHVRRFEADTVLDWFRSIWRPIPRTPSWKPGRASRFVRELIGRDLYQFSLPALFEKIHEYGWPPPTTMRELAGRLKEESDIDEVKSGPHHLQYLIAEPQYRETAVYVFDDYYAAEHPDRVAFLARDGWELPDGAADGPFRTAIRYEKGPAALRREGATYVVALAAFDECALSDLTDYPLVGRIDGVRLPDLPRYLFAIREVGVDQLFRQLVNGLTPFTDAATGDEKSFLASVQARPVDEAAWAAYSDWLEEHDHPPAGVRVTAELLRLCPAFPDDDPGGRPGDLVLSRSHVAQACKGYRDPDHPKQQMFHHLVLFDDRWAAAHPSLANGLLRFASRWDVLLLC